MRFKAWLECRRRAAALGFPYHDRPEGMSFEEWTAHQDEWRDRLAY